MLRTLRCFAAGTILFAALPAQQPRPAFEAASIKLNTSSARGSSSHGSRGQVLMTNMSLRRLVERAYDVSTGRVAGPDWMDDQHFDIAAKYPPDMKDEDRAAMIRTLLEDRFRLAVHRETREVSGYVLERGKGAFPLKPVEPGGQHISSEGDVIQTFTARKVSMALLADNLVRFLREPVADRTGIEGVYDIDLRWRIEDSSADDRASATAAAIQDALGTIHLRLRPQKIPVEFVVVDRMERLPSEN